MRPRTPLMVALPRDFSRLRSYSAWCDRNGALAAASAGRAPEAPKLAAAATTSDRVREQETARERRMASPREKVILDITERAIAPQLGLVGGKVGTDCGNAIFPAPLPRI